MEEVKEKYLLNKIRCLKCGSIIGPHSMNGHRYYRCRGFNKKICSSNAIRADVIEMKIQQTLFEYAENLKNINIEDLAVMIKRFNQEIIEGEGKLKSLQGEREGFLKSFFEDLRDRTEPDYKDKYIIAKYRNFIKAKNLLLFRLEELELNLLTILEELQKGNFSSLGEKDYIDFLNLTAFKESTKEKGLYLDEDPKLYHVYLNISEGTGKIVTANPRFHIYEDIPFRINPLDAILPAIPKKPRKKNSGQK